MNSKLRSRLVSISMVGPAILFILILLLYPLLYSLYLSLTDYYFLEPNSTNFIGLGNYIGLISDGSFRAAFINSILFGVIYIPSITLLSLVTALTLYQLSSRITNFLRSIMFLPLGIGLTMVALMWIWMLKSNGIVNYGLSLFHLPKVQWLGSGTLIVISTVIMTAWKFLGFNVLLFLAGLNNIPGTIFEAATIDGASAFQSLRHIAVPLVKETMAIVIINSTIASVKVYAQVWSINRGGGLVDVLYTYMYKTSFRYFEMGKGAAIAFYMGLVVLVISFFTLRLNRE